MVDDENDDTAIESPREIRRAWRWRRFCALGGILLIATFFMPAGRGCGIQVVPVQHSWLVLTNTVRPEATFDWLRFVETALYLAAFISAHLFGLLVALVCFFGQHDRRHTEPKLTLGFAALVGLPVILVAIPLFHEIGRRGLVNLHWDTEFILAVAFILHSPGYLYRSIRAGAAGLLCLRSYTAFWTLVWFVGWGTRTSLSIKYYGLWLSLLASFVILISTHAEARARSQVGWLRTTWLLLWCRLRFHDFNSSHCASCGYLLIRLPSNRCPECGREFDPNDYPVLATYPSRTGPYSSAGSSGG